MLAQKLCRPRAGLEWAPRAGAAVCLAVLSLSIHAWVLSESPYWVQEEAVLGGWPTHTPAPACAHTQTAIFRLASNTDHGFSASNWFHIAESVMGWHFEFGDINATEVFLVVPSVARAAEFTPMTRLLATVGIASPAVERVHFVVGDVASSSSHPHLHPTHASTPPSAVPATVHALVRFHFSFHRSQHPSRRFVQSASPSAAASTARGSRVVQVCGRWGGDVGRFNNKQGNWFPSVASVDRFRATLRRVCGGDSTPEPRPRHRVLVYQSDQYRRLVGLPAVVGKLEAWLPSGWDVRVLVHDERAQPCRLVHEASRAAVVLTPHGFQAMLLLFQSPPALLFEVFPFRFWERGFDPTARDLRITHAFERSPPASTLGAILLRPIPGDVCYSSAVCRFVSRGLDVQVSDNALHRIVNFAKLLPTATATTATATTATETETDA